MEVRSFDTTAVRASDKACSGGPSDAHPWCCTTRPMGHTASPSSCRLEECPYKEFDQLHDRWHPTVWFAARERLECDADADDAAQRVFARLWARGSAAWRRDLCPTFFWRAVQHEALTLAREQQRRALAEGIVPWATSNSSDPEQTLMRAEVRARLHDMITHLPNRCGRAMSLRLDGWTQREIADRLAVTPKAVEKQLARGYRLLRGEIERSHLDLD